MAKMKLNDSLEKRDYGFKKKPKDKADFLIWTGDVQDKPGYWVEGSEKKEFKKRIKLFYTLNIN